MSWSTTLSHLADSERAEQIRLFTDQLELARQGRLNPRVFAELRLRQGAYGQRYDNGHQHHGSNVRTLNYPHPERLKGPDTLWEAPGMLRIKIPWGGTTADQLDILADLAEEVADGVAHVTTRQDIQLHFIHLDDIPDTLWRLAAVGLTTMEACGNSVRNVVAPPDSGARPDEPFDVTPHAEALARFLLAHPDTQAFGRKVKIAVLGSLQDQGALAWIHDIAAIARINDDGDPGFRLMVGGGLGSVPRIAEEFSPFIPVEELLPLSQAIARVFARLGEKKNRARARLKFLLGHLGLEKFRHLVNEERQQLEPDPRWTEHLKTHTVFTAVNSVDLSTLDVPANWLQANVRPQRQPGQTLITLALPLGDISVPQLHGLAELVRREQFEVRFSVEQNIVLRNVAIDRLPAIHQQLAALHLAAPTAGGPEDIVSCPGTDTCKLGIASSRGLAARLHSNLAHRRQRDGDQLHGIRLKISGCFNSCGQHHVADIGFHGVSRQKHGQTVPHFQILLGGRWSGNTPGYGLPVVAVPSRRAPAALDLLLDTYLKQREEQEFLPDWVARVGRTSLRALFDNLIRIEDAKTAAALATDWGDHRPFSIRDLGIGECAGEVVDRADIELAAAEGDAFEAQVHLDNGNINAACASTWSALLHGALAMIELSVPGLPFETDVIIHAFDNHVLSPGRLEPLIAGAKAGADFLRHARDPINTSQIHERLGETLNFLETAHRLQSHENTKMNGAPR